MFVERVSFGEVGAKELQPYYVGNYWTIATETGKLGIHNFLRKMIQEGEGKPILVLNTPGSSFMGRKILIKDPKAIKELNFKFLHSHTTRHRSFMAMRRLIGPLALLTSDSDEYHIDKKKGFLKYFGPTNIKHFLPIMSYHIRQRIQTWSEQGEIKDLYPDVRDTTIGIIKEITFGIREDSNSEMGELLGEAVGISAKVPLDIYFQALYFETLQEAYISYAYPELQENSNKVHGVIEELLNRSDSEEKTYLNYLRSTREDPNEVDSELINDLLTAYIGGHDTTTSFLTFLTEHLAFHPDLQREIQEEIRSVYHDGIAIDRVFLSRDRLPKLNNFVESFPQMTPPVGASGRDVTENFELELDDYTFKFYAGDQILVPIAFLYDESVNDYAGDTKLSFLNSSLHTCPGQFFAKTEAKIFLILSLYEHFFYPKNSEKVERVNRGTTVGKDPIRLKFKRFLHDHKENDH